MNSNGSRDLFPASAMTEGEARECIEDIKRSVEHIRVRVLELYERRGWQALGYGSWRDCVVAEFDQSQSYLYRQLQAALIEREISPLGEIGQVPERQLRPLASVPEGKRREVWEAALTTAPDGKMTARHVEATADAMIPATAPLPNQPDLWPDDDEGGEDETEDEPEPEVLTEATPADPDAGWSTSELERRNLVMLSGLTVLANQHCDQRLIAWARDRNLYVPIDRNRATYPLGNPMRVDTDHDRDAVIAWYRDHWLPFHYDAIDWDGLAGKVLGCWCYPEPCHGDLLIENLPHEDAGHEAE